MPKSNVNGVDLYWEVEGEGEPLLLIPGLGMGTSYFDRAVPYLSKSAQTIALDLRGIGRSDKPVGPYSMEVWADDVVGLLDVLDIPRAHIVGASLGGCIAMAIADRHPDRVASLELVAAFSELDYALELNWRMRMRIVEQTGMTGPIVDHVILWTLSRRFLETDEGEGFADLIRNGIGANDPKLYLAFLKAILDFGRVTPETEHLPRYTELLRGLDVPTLFVVGAEDILTPPVHSERAAAAMPDGRAEVYVIPECGHITMIEAPESNSRAVLDFVERVAPKAAA